MRRSVSAPSNQGPTIRPLQDILANIKDDDPSFLATWLPADSANANLRSSISSLNSLITQQDLNLSVTTDTESHISIETLHRVAICKAYIAERYSMINESYNPLQIMRCKNLLLKQAHEDSYDENLQLDWGTIDKNIWNITNQDLKNFYQTLKSSEVHFILIKFIV